MNNHQRVFCADLAKSFLWGAPVNRNPYAGITNRAPGRRAAYIAHGLPSRGSGNPQIRANLLHEANKEMVRYGRSAKSVGRKLATSTQRLVGTRTTIAPAAAPYVGFGGSGYTGAPATVLGATPTRGYQTTVAPSAPVGVQQPAYTNPAVQGYPSGSAIRNV